MKLMDRQRRRRLARQAAEWTTTLDRGDPKDEAPFNAWWSRSWRHTAAAMDMAAMENEIARALGKSQESPSLPVRGRTAMPRWLIATSAAAAVATVIVGMYAARPLFAPTIEYSTGTGELHLVHLDDGTAIHINTQSKVAVHYSRAARSIELEGEALFDVGADPRPFQVQTGAALIRDIGTRFNVRHRAGDIDVAVISGEVQLSLLQHGNRSARALPASINLRPGQAAHIDAAAPNEPIPLVRVTQLGRTEIEERVLWTAGMLAFTGQSLAEVVTEVNRYNRQQLSIADAETGKVTVGGHFRAQDLDSFIGALDNLGIRAAPTTGANGAMTIELQKKSAPDLK